VDKASQAFVLFNSLTIRTNLYISDFSSGVSLLQHFCRCSQKIDNELVERLADNLCYRKDPIGIRTDEKLLQ
jgi:hypothetical protein